MALFSAFDKRTNDNSVRYTVTSDSYNTTTSWSQGISDVGNTTVNAAPVGTAGALSSMVPVLIVGLVVVGLIGISRGRA